MSISRDAVEFPIERLETTVPVNYIVDYWLFDRMLIPDINPSIYVAEDINTIVKCSTYILNPE